MSLVSSMLTTIKRVNCDKVHEVPEKFKHAIVGLNDEMGELNEVLKRALYYGDPIDDDNVLEEYGDMMYYIILDCMRIAQNKKMSEEQVFATIFSINSAKLKVRYPEHFSEAQATESGRNLDAEKKAMTQNLERLDYHPDPPKKKSTSDMYEEICESSLVGRTVIVYDRYHFALPLRGKIEDVAGNDGAYKVLFYDGQHGDPNYHSMDHTYFFAQQCEVLDDAEPEPRVLQIETEEVVDDG